MKKLLSVLLAICLLAGIIPALAADPVTVYVMGERLTGAEAKIIDDRTFLPVRAISEAMGIEVDWVDETKSVILGKAPESTQKGDGVSIYLEGELLKDSEAVIIDDFTYVPVRAISEAMGFNVEWVDETRSVYISEKTDLDGGYYRLKHVKTGYYLSVENANRENGAKIVVAANSNNDNQLWGFSKMGGGFYKVYNKNTGKSLDIGASSTEKGKEVTQYTANGGYNQQVSAKKNSDGSFTFVFRHSSLALTASERYTTQEEETGDDTQRFTVEYVEPTPMGKLFESDGYKKLSEADRERFDSYIFSPLPFSTSLYNQTENELIAKNYFSLSADEQANVLLGCLKFVPYNLVYTGEVYAEHENAKYEILSKTYEKSYDVWRGTMQPVWMYKVRMDGDVEGQVHEWTMISTIEDSTVVFDAIDALSRFPYAMRKFIKRLIYRSDNANNYNGGGDTIWIRLNFVPSQNAIAQTLAHELGHVLDSNATSDYALWDRAIAADRVPVSGYGNNNRTEDLAEFSRLYHMTKRNPDDLKELEKVYPNRFAAYAALLFAADSKYYSHYKSYYEASMRFDDDDKIPVYVAIGLSGTDLVLTAENPTEKGSNLVFKPYDKDNAAQQVWRMRETGGKKAIFNTESGLCVNVPGNSKDDGKNLILWNGGKGDNETAQMIENADGTVSFKFTHSGLYLGAEKDEAGAKAIQTAKAAKLEIKVAGMPGHSTGTTVRSSNTTIEN